MSEKHVELESNSRPNSVYPINDDDKPPIKDENEGLIKYPQIFQVSQDVLVGIVKEAEKRKFSEEIDRLETLGGFSFLL